MKYFISTCLVFALSARVAAADTSADVQKFVAFFDKIVDTVVADKDDCGKMAKDLNTLIDANKDVIEAAKKAQAEGKQVPPEVRQHMMDGAKKMMAGMQKCGSDPAVKAAFDRLPKHGPPPAHK